MRFEQYFAVIMKEKGSRIVSTPFFLVFASGFEPLAFRLGGGRSILLSYANMSLIIYRLMLIGKYDFREE